MDGIENERREAGSESERIAREEALAEQEPVTEPISSEELPRIGVIESLFFAYREFIGDPDRILARLGFGRAHHRALYFVNRNPGMNVAELIAILRITKQSLSRVLRELIEAGHIRQEAEQADRRKRRLYPTRSGRALILELSRPQSRRIDDALRRSGLRDQSAIVRFMSAMIESPPDSDSARKP